MAPSTPPPPDEPLLTQRAALLFLLAMLVGLLAGVLAHLDGHTLAGAALIGGSAFAGALVGLNKLIH